MTWRERHHAASLLVALLCISAVATCLPKRIHPRRDDSGRTLDAELDRVNYLPGWGSPSFRLYSGYITVSEEHQRAFFYVFAEAQQVNPLKAPVVIWLNGGPGCSSLGGGFLSELGPFYPRKDGKSLQPNPFAWNQKANIIFLESPAFVGFSYSNTSSDIKTGDKQTAVDNYAFLKGFFKRHAVHAASPFWIAGESYGGHYLPQLADQIVSDPDNSINFQGFMLGNPLTDPFYDSQGALRSWYAHGMISDESFSGASNSCNFSLIPPLLTTGMKSDDQLSSVNEDICDKFIEQAETELGAITIYDIYEDICLPARATSPITQLAKLTAGKSAFMAWRHAANQISKSRAQTSGSWNKLHGTAERDTTRQVLRRSLAEPSRTEYQQPQLSHRGQTPSEPVVDQSNMAVDQSNMAVDQSNRAVDQSNMAVDQSNMAVDQSIIPVDQSTNVVYTTFWGRTWQKLWSWWQPGADRASVAGATDSNDDSGPPVDPCVDNEVASYFNTPEVQVALHANTSGQVPGPWADCNDRIDYSFDDLMTTMMPLYPKLIAAGLKIVIYSGDVDGILPTLGTRTWVKALGLKVVSKWNPWTDSAGQPGGWAEVYENKVAIVTVRNAGHMVPYTQPRRAYDLFQCIVLDSPPTAGPLIVAQQFTKATETQANA